MENKFIQKKNIIIEVVVLVMFLGLIYYAYNMVVKQETEISRSTVNEQLLGQNFIMFLKVVNQEGLSFKDISILQGELVNNLEDFREEINESSSRGRDNPFAPYATSRSTR